MPDLNGLQALARLQESHATEHIPVIILSSNAFLDEHRRCVEAGAFLYMTKPYRLVALMAAVDAALTHSATVYKAKLTA